MAEKLLTKSFDECCFYVSICVTGAVHLCLSGPARVERGGHHSVFRVETDI